MLNFIEEKWYCTVNLVFGRCGPTVRLVLIHKKHDIRHYCGEDVLDIIKACDKETIMYSGGVSI